MAEGGAAAAEAQLSLTHAVFVVGGEVVAVLAQALEGAQAVDALAVSADLTNQSAALIHIYRNTHRRTQTYTQILYQTLLYYIYSHCAQTYNSSKSTFSLATVYTHICIYVTVQMSTFIFRDYILYMLYRPVQSLTLLFS